MSESKSGSASQSGQIDTVMHESRLFPPSAEFAAKSRIGSMEAYEKLWNEAKDDPTAFWDKLAKEELHWFEPYTKTLEWDEPFAKWFVGGKTNACYNCVDKHIDEGNGDKVAIVWEGEPGDTRTLTYSELHKEVCKFANALKGLGVGIGDVVSIYMPMTPEIVIAFLAIGRIGGVILPLFSGYGAEAVATRLADGGVVDERLHRAAVHVLHVQARAWHVDVVHRGCRDARAPAARQAARLAEQPRARQRYPCRPNDKAVYKHHDGDERRCQNDLWHVVLQPAGHVMILLQ